MVKNKQIFIKHLKTNFMIAYSFTKELPPKIFHEHVAHTSVLLLSVQISINKILKNNIC